MSKKYRHHPTDFLFCATKIEFVQEAMQVAKYKLRCVASGSATKFFYFLDT